MGCHHFQAVHYGPSDVWLDTQVLDYIRKGSTAADLPSHDVRRVTRRAKNYLMHDDKLFRLFDSGERKEVPPPHARAEIVRYIHVQHGHFGSRRTVNLMYPNFFWANMGRYVGMFKSLSVAVIGSIPHLILLPSN